MCEEQTTVSHYSLKILHYAKALKSNVWLVSDSKMDGTDAKTPLALMCVLAERGLALFEKAELRMGFKCRSRGDCQRIIAYIWAHIA